MQYKHKRYDESIMQSSTVGNIVEALKQCLDSHNKLEDCAYFIITTRNNAMNKGNSRKAAKKNRRTE